MDSDEEVTREPFEQQEDDSFSVHSNLPHHQPPYDNEEAQDQTHFVSEKDQAHEESHLQDHLDESSTADSEDVNFAESFGVHLRAHKRKKHPNDEAYERLMTSNHFVEESTKNKVEPLIKTSVTSDCIYHKGTFYQKGDIVAVCDQDDGQVYFAQLTGFLQDQYCEKSASLYWLVPTRPTSREVFDPASYHIGLEDMELRKLDCMTFVRHCPHDYYWRRFLDSSSAARLNSSEEKSQETRRLDKQRSDDDEDIHRRTKKTAGGSSYIWTTMEPCKVPQITATQRHR